MDHSAWKTCCNVNVIALLLFIVLCFSAFIYLIYQEYPVFEYLKCHLNDRHEVGGMALADTAPGLKVSFHMILISYELSPPPH